MSKGILRGNLEANHYKKRPEALARRAALLEANMLDLRTRIVVAMSRGTVPTSRGLAAASRLS